MPAPSTTPNFNTPHRAFPFPFRAGEYPGDAEIIEQVILRAFDLPVRSLMSPSRGPAEIAFARQVAIYVAHVQLGMTLTMASRLFGRDRTTGAHACRLVEDRRDDRKIDSTIEAIERALGNWRFPGRRHGGATPPAGGETWSVLQ